METSFFNKCFEKHSFQELNNIDVNMLYNVMRYHLKLFPESKNGIFFDVGTNGGSFIKVLHHLQIYNNIYCFEPHPILSKYTKNVYKNIIMNQLCLLNKDGKIDIHFPMLSVGLSSIVKRSIFNETSNVGEIKKITVPCLNLDTYCNKNNIKQIHSCDGGRRGRSMARPRASCPWLGPPPQTAKINN